MILICVALKEELPSIGRHTILYTGVGKVQAATRLAYQLGTPKHQQITEVWNYGSAGGLNPIISGLVEIGTFVQRDMQADILCIPRGTTPFSDPVIADINTHAPVMQVRCGTGDSFVTEPDPWFVTADIDCVDMEGYALASVCRQWGIPFRSWKYISDNADASAAQNWQANCHKGAELFRKRIVNGV